jgi:hypothetical protein
MQQTTFEEFVELARRGTFVPVWKEIMADLLTPDPHSPICDLQSSICNLQSTAQ